MGTAGIERIRKQIIPSFAALFMIFSISYYSMYLYNDTNAGSFIPGDCIMPLKALAYNTVKKLKEVENPGMRASDLTGYKKINKLDQQGHSPDFDCLSLSGPLF
jgi:hypothetical protein